FIALLGVRTIIQTGVWHDERALFENTLKVNPSSVLAHGNLGDMFLESHQLDSAEKELLAANRANPNFLPAIRNLIQLAEMRGQIDEPSRWRRRASEVQLQLPPELRGIGSGN